MRKSLAKAVLCSIICAGVYGSSFVAEAAEQEPNWTLIVENGKVTKQEGTANTEKRYAGAYASEIDKNAISNIGTINITNSDVHMHYNSGYTGIYGSFAKSENANATAENGMINISYSTFKTDNNEYRACIFGSFADISNLPPNTDNFKKAIAKDGTVIIDNSKIYSAIAGTYVHNTSGELNASSAEFKAINGEIRIGDNTYIKGDVVGSLTEAQSSTTYTSQGKVYIEGENIKIDAGYIVGGFSKNNVGVANSDNNEVTIQNATIITSNYQQWGVIGSYAYTAYNGSKLISATNSKINIIDADVEGYIYGNFAYTGGSKDAVAESGNIYIANSSISKNIYGGRAVNAINSSSNNFNIQIVKSTVQGSVYGGRGEGQYVKTNNNKLKITQSKVYGDVYGGYDSVKNIGSGNIIDNEIILEGKNILGNNTGVAAAYVKTTNNDSELTIKNNTIKFSCASNIDYGKTDFYGYVTNKQINDNDIIENNNLIVDNWSGTVGSVNNFNNIKFQNIEWENKGNVLSLLNNEADSLKDTTIDVKESLTINNTGTKLNVGDYMYFVYHDDSSVKLGTQTVNGDGENVFTSGVAVQGKGKVEIEDDGDVKYTITDTGTTDQSKNTTDYNSVAAAFLITGSDLVVDGLNAMEQDQLFGTKTFAIVEGVDKTFEVADDLDVNGWNGLYGVGDIKKTEDGTLSYAAFFENGTANYRTYNTFLDEAFRGDGSVVYNGGGIAGRYKYDDGVYAEASVRAGLLKNQMKNVFRDGNGQTYGYKTESPYWALHAGVGKIYDVGYNRDLDVYARYYHTYNDGDSFTVAGDHFDVDDIVSDRLRLGVRYNTNKFNKWKTYYGAAWEYEFNGDSKVHINGDSLATESLKGGSCFAEIGFNYQKDKSSPWDFEGRVRGYAGYTKGFSGMLRATYSF